MNAEVQVTVEVTYRFRLDNVASLDDAETQALCLVEEHFEDAPEAVADFEMDIYDVDSFEVEED